MGEQRRYLRFNSQASVILKPDDGTGRTINTELVDISFGGIGVYSKENIETGINVEFKLTTGLWDGPINGTGKVMHSRGINRPGANFFRVGVDFVTTDKNAILCVINSLQQDICVELREKNQPKKPHPR